MVYHVSMSLKQERLIRALDEKVLRSVLEVSPSASNRHETVFNCHCPFCHGIRRGQKSQPKNPHATANVFKHRNGEGLAFGCAACGEVVNSVHQLLCGLDHFELADWYATKRWDCDQACGSGWTCPNPQKVKKDKEANRRCKHEARAKKFYSNRPAKTWDGNAKAKEARQTG